MIMKELPHDTYNENITKSLINNDFVRIIKLEILFCKIIYLHLKKEYLEIVCKRIFSSNKILGMFNFVFYVL